MKTRIEGHHIHAIRMALGLDAYEFARVLCVNGGTVYRWEDSGAAPVSVTGLPAAVFRALESASSSGHDFAATGRAVRESLLLRGSLGALAVLLDCLLLKGVNDGHDETRGKARIGGKAAPALHVRKRSRSDHKRG